MEIPTEQQYYDGKLQDSIDLKKADFTRVEKEVMKYLVDSIESKEETGNLYEKVADLMGTEVEQIMPIIESIKQKMIQKRIVSKRTNGDYEFER